MTKAEFRQLAKDRRLCSSEEISGDVIYKELSSSNFYKEAKVVALYFPDKYEPDTKCFIEGALKEGKRVLLPKWSEEKKDYAFAEISSLDDLEIGRYGIMEPKADCCKDVSMVDVCYVPGVLFDCECNRLGHGNGFYDRLLQQLSDKVEVVGLAFSWQVVEQLPVESTDVRMDRLFIF